MLRPADLELRDLRLVAAIFREKTTTAAARSLSVSQSAVSHQLRSLEERLEQEVFARKGRRLQITDVGERLLELAQELLPQISALESDLLQGRRTPRVTLRVATQCYTAYHWLPVAFTALARAHPEVELVLVPEVTCDPVAALKRGQLDLAMCISPEKDRSTVQQSLFSDEMILAVAPHHPLARRESVSGRELVDEHVVLYDSAAAKRSRVGKVLFPKGGGFHRVTRLPLTEAICQMVIANLGVSILPKWSVAPYVQRGEIKCVRLTARGIHRQWVGVYSRDTHLNAPIRILLSVLAEVGAARYAK
jgi:LysR family transcriptional regulator for metE and metH